ncbi:MAG: uracil-DNA glycosylase [Desulfobacterales bacterium]
MSLESLNNEIRNCKKCKLWKNAQNAVPGEGDTGAKVMLVGQNPGKKEDETGRPFVGRAGKYLDKILKKYCMERKILFITSVVKHASPDNRKPKADEIDACLPYLEEQIRLIRPKVIVLMGKVAWKIPRQENIEYIETYHPAAAMRFPKIKKKFKDDFKTVSSKL